MTKIVDCRMRSQSCPEPLEKQKTTPLEIDYEIVKIEPIKNQKWITDLFNKYFPKEEK